MNRIPGRRIQRQRIIGLSIAGGAASLLLAAMYLVVIPSLGISEARAQTSPEIPNFYPSVDAGWVSLSNDYIPSESGPAPVTFDPAYPYVGNRQPTPPTFRVADLSHPNVMPWALETMKAPNEGVIAGGMGFTPRSACRLAGVPAFFLFVREPIFIFQGKDEVAIVYSGDSQIRRIHMNVPHAADLKPSWHGDSVGHYEGDTLVIDTIGLDTRSYVDNYRTPHSENLHVSERWSMNEAGDILEVEFTVEDEKTFYEPWTAYMRYGQTNRPMEELPCAENNRLTEVAGHLVPTATKLDF
ncbi:MAG: hypothetical protein ACKVG0_06155 [Alphaproteobacteria bacterium]